MIIRERGIAAFRTSTTGNTTCEVPLVPALTWEIKEAEDSNMWVDTGIGVALYKGFDTGQMISY